MLLIQQLIGYQHMQSCIRIIEICSCDLCDFLYAVGEGIAVQVQRPGCGQMISLHFQVDTQCIRIRGVMPGVVIHQFQKSGMIRRWQRSVFQVIYEML